MNAETHEWFIQVDDQPMVRISTKEELRTILHRISSSNGHRECSIELRTGKRSGFDGWLYRTLGLSTDMVEMTALAVYVDDAVALSFIMPDGAEEICLATEDARRDKPIRFFHHGEMVEEPAEHLLNHGFVERALLSFFENRALPKWIKTERRE